MSKNLNLSVYERYFNAIESGAKDTEYRDIKDYWTQKLVDLSAYPNKDVAEVQEGLMSGKLEIKPIKYDTLTFYTTRAGGKRASLVIEWKDTVVHAGHKYFAIRLGDLKVDSNGKAVKPKNR